MNDTCVKLKSLDHVEYAVIELNDTVNTTLIDTDLESIAHDITVLTEIDKNNMTVGVESNDTGAIIRIIVMASPEDAAIKALGIE